ncbi:hypothetical protein NE236_23620 [Actinoallomurus purpureus]|uniref:hypothetical protein n=1 Tax=Actinoallomurus purpureus TaxID=478114 RepID=UPI002092D244|nr:hypothetical protein [Actinoallomurus purpureus]MCO6007972.1 hypothetical protein [Actinoallomurus purpureus]
MKTLARSAATLLAAGTAALTIATAAHAEQWVTVGSEYETLSSCNADGRAYAAKYHPSAWKCRADTTPGKYGYFLTVFE